ncbi:MAG: sigma-54 dependent transcriptional regulator, partial [Candidatus Hydrogenedentes bacterium]|nr:sigma-54 dependent transcriptional regulator [Candidatus Hydrogenedentota bacterium]
MSAKPRILVVDDDPGQRSLLQSFLANFALEIELASSGGEALERLSAQEFDMMISDVRMPGMTGLELFERLRKTNSTLPVLLVTAYPEVRDAVAATRDGAVNYLEKPIDLDELAATVREAIGMDEAGAGESLRTPGLPEWIIAHSPAMKDIVHEVSVIAPSESRVLITGESGVGKEAIAELLHLWSARAGGPLVKVNCAAIPESLLESELFGHEKGAFTGAAERRVGRVEEAAGGTLLLDEIAEMAPQVQAKLLRFTQDGTFQRLGSNAVIQADARVLASTNRNLDTEVAEGRFREDLFFRLNVVEIHVPPLRDRKADIVPLATRFAAEFAKGKPRLSPAFVSNIEVYEWSGNVRELRNAIERACLMARGEVLLPENLPERVRGATSTH